MLSNPYTKLGAVTLLLFIFMKEFYEELARYGNYSTFF